LVFKDNHLRRLPFLISAAAVTLLAAPAGAQSMPGMSMPMPANAAPSKQKAHKPAAAANPKLATNKRADHRVAESPPATHVPDSGRPNGADQGAMAMPKPVQSSGPQPEDHSSMPGMQMGKAAHDKGGMVMPAAFGPYPMQREASGTSWQPDTSAHEGLMTTSGEWTLMAHGVLNLVTDHQSGPRGNGKAFASGMLMGMANHPLGDGRLQLKAMVSPDALMGPSGYPLLLASGETANGRDRLIDRQHPHDFVMELSASASQNLGPRNSAFLYAALPGEPAFGPPSFQDREAIADSPEAPITHHWLDSTHISFGVVTAGLVIGRAKIELSRFNGREPDQHRWNIETGPLDSTAVRLSWNPTSSLALQGSWGHLVDPEQLEPGVNQKRLSASALYAREIAPGWKLAGALAWGRKTVEHHNDDAWLAEASLKHQEWTIFGRGEITENRELVPGDTMYRVGKVSIGALRDFKVAEHLSVGAGGLFSLNLVPDSIAPLYGGRNPAGAMAFVRLKLN